MTSWFERLIAPLKDAPVTRPPDTLVAFYRHFLSPVKGTIVAVLVISLVTAVTEMGLFVFLGVTPHDQDPAKAAPNHSPNFLVDESALVVGTRTMASLAVNFLSEAPKE